MCFTWRVVKSDLVNDKRQMNDNLRSDGSSNDPHVMIIVLWRDQFSRTVRKEEVSSAHRALFISLRPVPHKLDGDWNPFAFLSDGFQQPERVKRDILIGIGKLERFELFVHLYMEGIDSVDGP